MGFKSRDYVKKIPTKAYTWTFVGEGGVSHGDSDNQNRLGLWVCVVVSFSLEKALGLSANAEKCGEEQVQRSGTELKVASRRRRVFELRCLGYKIPDIVKKLAEENQFWSEDTVFRDLHSDDAKAFLEELHRQQFADITLTSSRRLKLEFRDRMIERFTPRKSPEAVVNLQNNISVENNASVNQLLEHYQTLSSKKPTYTSA